MKVSEYIRRKNAIIEKATGIILVPDDQIIDLNPTPLNMGSDPDACPYCNAFYNSCCVDCPMTTMNNSCFKFDSTYHLALKVLDSNIIHSGVRKELSELIDEYNESNGFYSD